MLIAKLAEKQAFYEVLMVGSVRFDPRSGWVLLGDKPGSHKSNLVWIHPDDTRIEWIRDFTFGE